MGDVLEEDFVPLHYYHSQDRPAPPVPSIEGVVSHRRTAEGTYQFLVRWKDSPANQDTWMDLAQLVSSDVRVWEDYCHAHGIESIPLSSVGLASSVSPSSLSE